jgi:hypothetical protein
VRHPEMASEELKHLFGLAACRLGPPIAAECVSQ